MFSYYGSKSKIIDLYPPPQYDTIIEPFAGSARYALKYWDRNVILTDKYPVIIDIWKWLQQCSEKDIQKLPRVKFGQKLDSIDFDCIESRNLMGFLIKSGTAIPANTPSYRQTTNRPNLINYSLNNIASNIPKIKHWDIRLSDYREIENINATWFIDPPYMFWGEHYKMSSKELDFLKLGEWCKSRNGQIIVCENTKADWLPFKAMKPMQGSIHITTEAIWTNRPTSYGVEQGSLFSLSV